MYSRAIRLKKLGWVTIHPLAKGDTATVAAIFEGLSDEQLARLATVDGRRHALVAFVEGDDEPAGFAQLARNEEQRTHAEITLAVADRYHGRGIDSTLVDLLAGDARAAGITHLTATTRSSSRDRGGEAKLVAVLAAT